MSGSKRQTNDEGSAPGSADLPPPGATGPHANPVGPGTEPPPRPEMPATGAPRGPHGPGPDAPERRVAQHDWSRWRAADRRTAPFEYPSWKS
ncbi:MAG: hypothetical protein Q8P18_24120 [Pseudomonadota bacterium]|nr:hypothetical protein [Pseudomonadota bacterium]